MLALGKRHTRHPGSLATVLIIALAILAPIGSALAGQLRERPRHSCGHVGSSVGGGYGDIHAYGLSCSAARRVIRSSMRGEPHGWTFIPGSGRDEYRKGHKRITGVPLGD